LLGSPEKLLKWISYTLRIRQQNVVFGFKNFKLRNILFYNYPGKCATFNATIKTYLATRKVSLPLTIQKVYPTKSCVFSCVSIELFLYKKKRKSIKFSTHILYWIGGGVAQKYDNLVLQEKKTIHTSIKIDQLC
jgi:hypothetical protein